MGLIAHLTDRGVITVSGADAVGFLDGLATARIATPPAGMVGYGALLTPQGKILFDFFGHPQGDVVHLDAPRGMVADLIKRLGFYRLRAKVTFVDQSDTHGVFAIWGMDPTPTASETALRDPRHALIGSRLVRPLDRVEDMLQRLTVVDEASYHRHRISLGLPEGGRDFSYGDAFPHDADLDQISGVDFRKGCYVGQEVVSRMQHRGLARRRIVLVHAGTALPYPGTEITAGGRPIGTLGSSDGSAGLAMVRLDRAKEAIDAGLAITAADVVLNLTLPPWASFTWPDTATASDA